ncbi:hypothetical protein G6F57_022328 [Rhizopus arrhizus]|nr:hypothetical protein G6F57_022328 [Rhizopus arrhizus]
MRAALARVEQNLALVAQTQRDADRQMQVLEQRRERLQQELRELHAPDPVRLEQPRARSGCRAQPRPGRRPDRRAEPGTPGSPLVGAGETAGRRAEAGGAGTLAGQA